jgi:hypothetical protein
MKKAVKKSAASRVARQSGAGISDPAVDAVFSACPAPVKSRLLALRRLIFDTARMTKGVGAIEETLKWGQPSYLTSKTRSGSTIRIDRVKADAVNYAVLFHCQTDLVETFRQLYPTELRYGGKRGILLNADDEIPEAALRHCVALALTYHLRKRRRPISAHNAAFRARCPKPSLRAKRSNPSSQRKEEWIASLRSQ